MKLFATPVSPAALLLLLLACVAASESALSQTNPGAPSKPAAALDLDGLKKLYQTGVERLDHERDDKLSKVNASYGAGLDRLRREATTRGDLDGALAVKAEHDRWSQGIQTSATDKKAMSAKLLELRTAYERASEPIVEDCQKRMDVLGKQYLVSLEQLQKQLVMANQLDNAVAARAEADRIKAMVASSSKSGSAPSAPTTSGNTIGLTTTGGAMTAAAAKRLFQLSEKEWKINGNVISGHLDQEFKANPHFKESEALGPAQSIRFGFKIKAKWYHQLEIWVDGERFEISRGHWSNAATLIYANGQEQRLKGIVESPDRWYAIEGLVQDGKIRFYYAEKLEFEAPIKPPPPGGYTFNVGFNSSDADVQIKDVSYELNPPRK